MIREEAERGETDAVDFARLEVKKSGRDAVLIVPGDLPLVRSADIETVLAQFPTGPRVLCAAGSSHDRMGTNALLLAPPDIIKLRFGYDSFSYHMGQVSAQALPVRSLENERIALDIDEPKDLERFYLLVLKMARLIGWFAAFQRTKRLASRRVRRLMKRLELMGLEGVGEVGNGDSIGALICDACSRQTLVCWMMMSWLSPKKLSPKPKDELLLWLTSEFCARHRIASQLDKEPALVELILREAVELSEWVGGRLSWKPITALSVPTQGWTGPTSDEKSRPAAKRSGRFRARNSQKKFKGGLKNSPPLLSAIALAVHGGGTVDVAVGVPGLKTIKDERGMTDRYGYQLKAAVAALPMKLPLRRNWSWGSETVFPSSSCAAVRLKGRKGR